jgi:uncharacterized protein (DUF2141 family)
MKASLRYLALPASLLALASVAHAFDLTVEVLDARSEQGTVAAALYDAASWMRAPLQGERQPAAAKTVIVYRNVPAGTYAVSAFHDENGNGKLDTNVAGMPVERYGFSRDARGVMGPPSFKDAAIDLQADTTITIHLR